MEPHYGAEHPKVATTLGNLGRVFGLLGDFQKQKELLESSLKIMELQYGSGHPAVAMMLGELSTAFGDLGDDQKQQEMLERRLKIAERHVEAAPTLSCRNHVWKLGDHKKQKELLERSLKIMEQHLGTDPSLSPRCCAMLAKLSDSLEITRSRRSCWSAA